MLSLALDPLRAVDSRQRLTANLMTLMERHRLEVRHLLKLTNLSQKTFSNLIRCVHSTGLDTVDEIAAAFQLEGWELLAGGEYLDKAKVPIMVTKRASQTLARWPNLQTVVYTERENPPPSRRPRQAHHERGVRPGPRRGRRDDEDQLRPCHPHGGEKPPFSLG